MAQAKRRSLLRPGGDVRRLTHDQASELGIGAARFFEPGWDGSDEPVFFDSEEQREEAWRLHGERIAATWGELFRRPNGYWWYERDEDSPRGGVNEIVRLAELGELTPEELAEMPKHFSPPFRREILVTAVEALPAPAVRALIQAPGLYTGLTSLGIQHFRGQLAAAVRGELDLLLGRSAD